MLPVVLEIWGVAPFRFTAESSGVCRWGVVKHPAEEEGLRILRLRRGDVHDGSCICVMGVAVGAAVLLSSSSCAPDGKSSTVKETSAASSCCCGGRGVEMVMRETRSRILASISRARRSIVLLLGVDVVLVPRCSVWTCQRAFSPPSLAAVDIPVVPRAFTVLREDKLMVVQDREALGRDDWNKACEALLPCIRSL